MFLLVGIIAHEVWLVVQARRRGRAAARLHVQIVGLFAVIAAVPAILVAVVASVTLDRGLDRLFSTRTRAIIENSLIVADAYLQEHAQTDPRRHHGDVVRRGARQAAVRFRARALQAILHRAGEGARILGRVSSAPTPSIIERAESSRTSRSRCRTPPVSRLSTRTSRRSACCSAPIRSPPWSSCVATTIPISASFVRSIRASSSICARPRRPSAISPIWRRRRFGVQLAFALMYTVIALRAVSAAWIGLNFANQLVAPIRRLIGAAKIVSTGNLYIQVPVRRSEGDLAQLGETFNRMTTRAATQRDDIVRARDLIDQRRRFTEAVLAGASAGVIGVDGEGRISILNRSAEKLDRPARGRWHRPATSEIVPELTEIFPRRNRAINASCRGR